MKLNKRLLALSEMVTEPYELVWDCCCDHGLLGFKILADGLIKQVNFVDVVPSLMTELTTKLDLYAAHLPADSRWKVLCQDVADLTLEPVEQLQANLLVAEDKGRNNTKKTTEKVAILPATARHLVIISGVGGELMITILSRLMARYSGKNIDFLLCPVQHTYKLRVALKDLGFKIKSEQLVTDNHRGYELMLVNQLQGETISVIGNKLWLPQQEHACYLNKLIKHYQQVNKGKKDQLCLEKSALVDYMHLQQQSYNHFFKGGS